MGEPSARQILQALAQGVDPYSGTELPPGTLLRRPQVLKSLLVAIAALEIQALREQRQPQWPENTGRKWSELEEQNLMTAFRRGEPLEEIAAKHARSLAGIEFRLEKLGLLAPRQRT